METTQLEQRMNRLERELRLWRLLAAAVLLAVAAFVAPAGCAQPRSAGASGTVEAQHFVVKTAEGRKAAELGLLPDGNPELALYDGKGVGRLYLTVRDQGTTGLMIANESQKPKVTIFTRESGLTRATIYNEAGVPKLWLNVGSHSQAAVTVWDEEAGKPIQFPDTQRAAEAAAEE